ncbi:hypothetical protein [Novipirellula artificiosorum]|uniref:Uncharacterized protein n=1 Tax=Novipirellula artificiosorum TaxID=2528016 RepID=A0A5C6D8J8_9BACT|nr:hypothetical protein [Novipirellula artificiosorum]TWU32027.1 hypothetical protein Poly41_59150 [Novipirellula artificiosorum]
MVDREPIDGMVRHVGIHRVATTGFAIPTQLLVLIGALFVATPPAIHAGDSPATTAISRQIQLEGPDHTKVMETDVVQVLDARGDPSEYFMDVDSVVCADARCEIITVRIHFDPLGNYERYEIPSGGNLTKGGHKPFSIADHKRLHQILSDPYSQLKSIGWGDITLPKSTTEAGSDVDAISGPTLLSKRNTVVVGAAYTCLTLWHWSHGQVAKVIREMTLRASDKQDLIRYLQSENEQYVVFAADQLRIQGWFDTDTLAAVVHVMRYGDANLTGPALTFLAEASSETGVDYFFRCCEEKCLVTDPGKRIRFLEKLRETTLDLPHGYLDRLTGWLSRAESHYEVHLLLSLMERGNVFSDRAFSEAMSLLESQDSLVVRRSYRFLKSQDLSQTQQKKLEP